MTETNIIFIFSLYLIYEKIMQDYPVQHNHRIIARLNLTLNICFTGNVATLAHRLTRSSILRGYALSPVFAEVLCYHTYPCDHRCLQRYRPLNLRLPILGQHQCCHAPSTSL